MDKEAARQAWERLHRARNAHQRIIANKSWAEAEQAWSDFLAAASTIFSKLEKGSKGHPKSGPWFGRIKNERKTDQLLSYIHHARNTDEHGIEKISRRRGSNMKIALQNTGSKIELELVATEEEGFSVKLNSDDAEMLVERENFKLTLIPVKDDRFNDVFDVPTSHLGKPLAEGSPLEISTLALQYLERIVRDGAELSK